MFTVFNNKTGQGDECYLFSISIFPYVQPLSLLFLHTDNGMMFDLRPPLIIWLHHWNSDLELFVYYNLKSEGHKMPLVPNYDDT